MNKIDSFEKKQIEKIIKKKSIPSFSYGDVLCVDTKVREGSRERVQQFEGVCITKKNRVDRGGAGATPGNGNCGSV